MWSKRKLSLSWLKKQAYDHRDARNIFGWLKAIGVVPAEVKTLQAVKPKTSLKPDAIEAGYIAAVAYEWDSWGPSSPVEFMRAMEMETEGNEGNDFVASLLRLLGRSEQDTMAVAA